MVFDEEHQAHSAVLDQVAGKERYAWIGTSILGRFSNLRRFKRPALVQAFPFGNQ
jgi:hypothetical protein